MILMKLISVKAIIPIFIIYVWFTSIALSDETQGKNFAVFRKEEMRDLDTKLATIPNTKANEPILAATRSMVTDADAIVSEVTDYFGRVRSATVGDLVNEAVGGSSRKPSRTTIISHADQVRNRYVKYHDILEKAYTVVSGDTPEVKIARQYMDGVLAVAEKFILIHAAELDAMGEGTVAAEWFTLVLLLHHKDEVWNKKLISSLPEWMRNMQSLKAAEYICLSVARPLAAYQLWGYQVSGDREEVLEIDSYLTNLHRRANACFGSKDFLKGIALIKSIIVLSEAKGMIDEAVKSHFRLAEVYAMYGHSQMAADEMKIVMMDYPNHKEYGKAVLMRLRYLYQSGMYEKILEEIPSLIDDKTAENYRPQIIYIAWVTNRRQNKTMEAGDLKKWFVRDYPNHPLCADMYFASAMELLAAGDYAGATQLLEMISECYEKTSIANKSREILTKMKENQKPVSGASAQSSNGG